MSDVVVTVPRRLWSEWLDEGSLPGEPDTGDTFHFWLAGPLPDIQIGSRVYIVAHGRLRGYAPLVAIERRCRLRPSVGCLVRRGGAVAVTVLQDGRPAEIRGFRGWKYRWWDYLDEVPYPNWKNDAIGPSATQQYAMFSEAIDA
jgi:hypothetical protein